MAAGVRFIFDPFELDSARCHLIVSGERVAISDRQLDVLLVFVVRAGQIVSKEDLLQAGWKDAERSATTASSRPSRSCVGAWRASEAHGLHWWEGSIRASRFRA